MHDFGYKENQRMCVMKIGKTNKIKLIWVFIEEKLNWKSQYLYMVDVKIRETIVIMWNNELTVSQIQFVNFTKSNCETDNPVVFFTTIV